MSMNCLVEVLMDEIAEYDLESCPDLPSGRTQRREEEVGMMMADIMIDNWAVIEQALRKAGATQEQIADALGAYKAICWRWVRTNSVAKAFQEKVQNEAPALYTRCARPAGLMDDIMRCELESWPDEWDEDPVEREAE